MSTENQISTINDLPSLGVSKYGSEDDFQNMVKSSFMPRVQVCTGTTQLVGEGKIKPGSYALVRNREEFVDLGETFNCLVFAMRYMAADFSDKANPEFDYDPSSEKFKDIQARAGEPNSGCQFGPQFLIYLPDLKEYATFFFGSTSAKPEARKLKQLMDSQSKSASFVKPRLLSNDKGRWHVPVIVPCSAQLAAPTNHDEFVQVGNRFLNPEPADKFETEQLKPGEEARAR